MYKCRYCQTELIKEKINVINKEGKDIECYQCPNIECQATFKVNEIEKEKPNANT